tara:strand:- start:82 stop:759 length:678 start_codon:yes stop_codon:yes gene_type:complete
MNNIKLCIFDVDGVIVNSRALHYPSTASALRDFGCEYSREEDEAFGTIPTREKLERLSECGQIQEEDIEKIWQLKDYHLCLNFDKGVLLNKNIKSLFQELRSRDIYIALGSNARYSFLEKVVKALDVAQCINHITSAQNMISKPDPYMYVQEMKRFEVEPDNTLIFEDSEVGRQAAYSSGAWVYEVDSYDELSIEILNEINSSSGQFKRPLPIYREQSKTNRLVY